MTSESRERRLITWAIALLATGVVLVWTLYQIREVLLLLYISGLLAVGFSPIVRWLERRRFSAGRRRVRLPRWAAILVLYLGFLAAVLGVLSVVIPPFAQQVRELWLALPAYVDQVQRRLATYGLPSDQSTWAELFKSLPSPELALGGLFSALQGVVGVISALVTVVVLPFYLLVEADSIQTGFLRLFAPERRPRVARVTSEVTVKVGAWLGGQLALSTIIGSTAALGLWLLGVPYFWVLALLAAVGELIPVVGPILAAVPAVLVAFTVSLQTGFFTAAYFVVQQFVENQFLVPRVMQRQVGVSAVAILIAFLIGTELLGIVGSILAVPTVAIVQVLFQEYLERDEA
jgi:predicted PurR-regulated permease PerM